jgi:hypothetical protein
MLKAWCSSLSPSPYPSTHSAARFFFLQTERLLSHSTLWDFPWLCLSLRETSYHIIKIQTLVMKITVLWDAALCSLVETDQRFRGTFSLHHQGEISPGSCYTSSSSSSSSSSSLLLLLVGGVQVIHNVLPMNSIFVQFFTSCLVLLSFTLFSSILL